MTEQEIIVNVIGESNSEIAEKMGRIGAIARAEPGPIPPVIPPPPATYMEVVDPAVILKAGETASVNILGGTSELVHGFNFTIGHSQYLTVEKVDWGEFFMNAVGGNFEEIWDDRPLGDPKIGRANTPNLTASLFFFRFNSPIDTKKLLLIPRDTIIASITVKLADNAQIAPKERDLRILEDGKISYRLDLADNKYGHPLSRCIYTLDAPALLPELFDGKIQVMRA